MEQSQFAPLNSHFFIYSTVIRFKKKTEYFIVKRKREENIEGQVRGKKGNEQIIVKEQGFNTNCVATFTNFIFLVTKFPQPVNIYASIWLFSLECK